MVERSNPNVRLESFQWEVFQWFEMGVAEHSTGSESVRCPALILQMFKIFEEYGENNGGVKLDQYEIQKGRFTS